MALPRIVWRSFSGSVEDTVPRYRAVRPILNRLSKAISSFGVPHVEGASSPKEDAVGLLMLAAEVEHALMVQYLYAAHSVRGSAGRTISHIAVQEMGHLVTVQNLLLALEGLNSAGLPARVHLGRDALRRTSTHNPLPLVLEPVSHTSLAKFIVVERPAAISDEVLRTRVEALEGEVAAIGVDPNPVYALYAALRWLFQAEDADLGGLTTALGFKSGWHLADSDFTDPQISAAFGAQPAEWGSVPGLIVASAENRAAALAAIDAITAQGEGALGTTESHFRDFLRLLDSFEAGQINVAPLPRTPFTTSQPQPEDLQPTKIVNGYTSLWADVFNLTYELLLVDIAWALSHARPTAARPALIDVCIDSMRRLIQPMATLLAKRPLAADPQVRAGPPYGLKREDLPSTPPQYGVRYRQAFVERDALITSVKASAEYGADLSGKLILNSIAEIDLQRASHLPGGT